MRFRLLFAVDRSGVLAVGVAGASDEVPVATKLFGQLTLAFRAFFIERLADKLFPFDGFDLALERSPEVFQESLPFPFAERNVIQIIFHVGGELVIDILVKELHQETNDFTAEILGEEGPFDQPDIFTLHQGVHRGRVGRRTTDAIFFKGFNQ